MAQCLHSSPTGRLPQCGDMLAQPGDQETRTPALWQLSGSLLGEGLSLSYGGGEK